MMKYVVNYLLASTLIICSCTDSNKNKLLISSTVAIEKDDNRDSILRKASHVVPTDNQLEALKDEFIAFIHFGPNTFTRMEWGNGKENPAIFNLKNLDTDQWCEAIKAAGMKKIILTAKHHDGFCLWQTRYTKHGIMSSPFKNGKGDVLKSLASSCEKYDLKLGVYLSPADLYQIESAEGLYGNLSEKTERIIPRPIEGRPFENKTSFRFVVDDYNEYFLNQLFELLTEYGAIDEVWFDGAHPKRKGGQQYDYLAWKEVINALAPQAVVFGKQDIRWCGNEAGNTRLTEWNVVPYEENPASMNLFPDITATDIGSEEKLMGAKFLHYQPAETNTSIREGWFYRDDSLQQVRSADDVLDIYERAVGGNSTFLLNIPPNRDGLLSQEDVDVLKEVGRRINNTYADNLLQKAAVNQSLLDNNISTGELMALDQPTLVITTPEAITVNRFVIQEAIASHGERIASHLFEAWINGKWTKVAEATNVGYKRILRFPELTSNKFRLTILSSRWQPKIAEIGAYYYPPKPPPIAIKRDKEGLVSFESKHYSFSWKLHGEDFLKNINTGVEYRYTTDGKEPTRNSNLYTNPFLLQSGEVQARSFTRDKSGSITSSTFGILQKDWQLIQANDNVEDHPATSAFDGNASTYWLSNKGTNHQLSLNLGKVYELSGFAYTPPSSYGYGMIEKGILGISEDGKNWVTAQTFEFGNLINDPSTRRHYFASPLKTQYVRIEAVSITGNHPNAAIAEIEFLQEK